MSDAILERDAILGSIRRLLDEGWEGRGLSLFVLGEARLDKTPMLELAMSSASGFRIGRGRADVAEALLPFGLLGQALEVLGAGPVELTRPRAGVLPSRAEYFYAVLGRIREVGPEPPVLLVLDDAQWSDPDSLTLLRLICRRIGHLPLAVLVATRTWPPDAGRVADELAAEGLAHVERLAPLSSEASLSVLSRASRVATSGADLPHLIELCAGNPLLLHQAATTVSTGGRLPTDEGSGAVSWARRLLLSHLAGFDADTHRFLRAAAILGRRFRPDVAAEMARLAPDDATRVQDVVDQAGLARGGGPGWAEFSHELVRQAVAELAGATRVQLHRAAFGALWARGVNPAELAEHAVAGRMVGDAEAVDALTWAGREALHAGAVGAATRHLQAAVEFAGREAAADVVYDLGRALTGSGDHDAAAVLFEDLWRRQQLPDDLRWATAIELARVAVYASRFDRAELWLQEALTLAGTGRSDLAAGVLVGRSVLTMLNVGIEPALRIATQARELASHAGAPAQAAADAAFGTGAYLMGDPSGLQVAELAVRRAATGRRDESSPWWDPAVGYGIVAISAERFENAERVLTELLEKADRRSDPWSLSRALFFLATGLCRTGRLREASILSDRLVEAADIVPVITPLATRIQALVLAELGSLEEAAEWCERLAEAARRREGFVMSVPMGLFPRATVALRRGEPAAACDLFTELEQDIDSLGLVDPCFIPWAADAVSAFLACDREDDARRVIERTERAARSLPASWPKVVVAAGHAALAERHHADEEAARRYLNALALLSPALRLCKVATLTAYGAFLCRHGDARAARPRLADALRLAEDCGAAWHAEQARIEWRRAGGRTGTTPAGELTPQEAAVARLAGDGRTNREIAKQLFLSVNTVETHLTHVYRKLGIKRRTQLTRWMSGSH